MASFRVDLAHHGFSTADLPSLAAHGATDRTVDPIGTEQLDAFAHYLVNQQTLGSTPHSAVRAWRNLPASAAAAHVETWRANDTADAHDENLVLGTVDITPPTWDQYGRLFHLGPIASRAFRARRVLLPDGSVRAEITLPVKLIHQPGEEHVAEAARRVARSSVDTYLNAPATGSPTAICCMSRWSSPMPTSPSSATRTATSRAPATACTSSMSASNPAAAWKRANGSCPATAPPSSPMS